MSWTSIYSFSGTLSDLIPWIYFSLSLYNLQGFQLGHTWMVGEGNGTPLQCSCLENPMDGGAWWAAVHGVAKSQTRLSDFTFAFHFHALEKAMATHSSVLAWRIPGTGELGGLPSMGSHRVGYDWSNLAACHKHHSPHFTDEETERQRSSYISHGIWVVLVRATSCQEEVSYLM